MNGLIHRSPTGSGSARAFPLRSALTGFAAALVFLAVASPAAAAPPKVAALRSWTAPDHTRIVLDLTASARFTHRRVPPAPGGVEVLLIEIAGASMDPAVTPLTVVDGVVRDVAPSSVGGSLRFAIGLEPGTECDVFSLDPVGDKPFRILADIHRPGRDDSTGAGGTGGAGLPPAGARKSGPLRVVIDAGHGGEDWGARGWGKIVEKKVTLDIARRVVRKLSMPGVGIEATLTRDGDYFLSLGKRSRIAEKAKADLFVSIHGNASENRAAEGMEVFFVSLSGATDKAAEELANEENAADLVGGVSPAGKADLLASEDLLGIVLDVTQSETISRSSRLAESIVGEVRRDGDVAVRGVKQAGFAVLKSVVVPSVLVEVGFLTNRDEAKRLLSESYRDQVAAGIADGVRAFAAREGSTLPGAAR